MGNPIARFDPDAGQGGRFASGHAGIWKEKRFDPYPVKVRGGCVFVPRAAWAAMLDEAKD
jgi:hypothetical protein